MIGVRQSTRRLWNDTPTWAQAALVLAVVLVISLMFPRGVRFDYTYEQGQRWRYDDLVAPFDFPVLKTAAELEDERRAVRSRVDPYYAEDAAVAARELAAYQAAFQAEFARLDEDTAFEDLRRRPEAYLQAGAGLLRRAYDRGVAEPHPSLEASPTGLVSVLRGGSIQRRTPAQLTFTEQARARVADSLRRLRDADFVIPLVRGALAPNLRYSDSLTQRFLGAELAELVTARGMVRQGEVIVTENGLITEDIARRLASYEAQYEASVVDGGRGWLMYAGYLLLTSVIMSVLLLYVRLFHRREFGRFNRLAFLLALILVACFATYRLESLAGLSLYVLPFAVFPIVIKNFYPPGIALFTHIVIVLLASFLSVRGYEFTFLQIVAGIVAVLTPTSSRDWSLIFRSILLLAVAYFAGFLALELIKEGRWESVEWGLLPWLGLNVFFTLLAYPLVPLLGRAFGFVSDAVLLELTDLSKPVLNDLGLRAPGTLQHSISVSNLAEAAARDISADTLLVKAAALYHDIGKAEHPLFFIENQGGRNPHDALDALESARVIVAHVPDGIRLAREAGLPEQLVDFIASHHGTSRVEYFYRTYVNEHPGEPVDDLAFRYPGPLPRSREEGILMLADGVEAAARALVDHTADGIDRVVDAIIDAKVAQGQLADCALSFRDVELCRERFKRMLKGMYHARVEYPDAVEAPSSPPAGSGPATTDAGARG